MKKKILYLIFVVIFTLAGTAQADTVELDLFTLGCQTEYDFEQSWTTDFDLRVTFTDISSVYIDWSGTITAELVVRGADPPFPINGQFMAKLYEADPYDYLGSAHIQSGATTYPDPEPFDLQSTFTNDEGWSMLLDGRGSIEIWFGGIFRPADLITVELPSGAIDSATLVFTGTVIPEPATILLFSIGYMMFRRGKNK